MAALTESPADRIYEAIRRGGGRITVPTRMVVTVLLGTDRHLTADDIIAEVERRTPGVAPSTIYRVLQRLDELEIVEHVHSGTGPTFFHVREQGHAHLVCNECGSIIDLPDRLFDGLARAVDRAYEFSLQPHHAALLGRCSRCRD